MFFDNWISQTRNTILNEADDEGDSLQKFTQLMIIFTFHHRKLFLRVFWDFIFLVHLHFLTRGSFVTFWLGKSKSNNNMCSTLMFSLSIFKWKFMYLIRVMMDKFLVVSHNSAIQGLLFANLSSKSFTVRLFFIYTQFCDNCIHWILQWDSFKTIYICHVSRRRVKRLDFKCDFQWDFSFPLLVCLIIPQIVLKKYIWYTFWCTHKIWERWERWEKFLGNIS